MFPLGTVLFPGTAIPLHVFEPRYRALTGFCIEHDSPLGIVLIERGSEVGGGDVRFSVGTQARIVDSAALPDGRWVLVIVGERRVRVDRWLGEEPFPRAEVTVLEDEGELDGVTVREALQGRLRQAVALKAALGEGDESEVALAADPRLAVWQAAASGLVSVVDAQRLLETDKLADRLARLTSLLDEELAVLALRAREG